MKRFQHSLAPVDTINTADEMLIHSDVDVKDGERVWVRAVRCEYVYRLNSGLVADGINVVASSFGPGMWQRLTSTSDPSWLTQATWYIDPTNGSDVATGLTTLTPIKTWAELRSRVMNRKFKQQTTIVIQTADLPITDPMIVDMGSEAGLTILGSGSIVRNSTLTSVTTRAQATNTPLKVKDGTFGWNAAGYVAPNYVLSMTAGVANGAWSFIALDETTGVARLLPMVDISGTEKTPGADTYVVTQMRGVSKAYISPSELVNGNLNIEFIAFPSIPAIRLSGGVQDSGITFTGCSFGTIPMAADSSTATFVGCRFCGGTFNNVWWTMRGGGTIGSTPMQFELGSKCDLKAVMAQSTGWVVADGSFMYAQDVGAMDFDGTQMGLQLQRGSRAWADYLWGKANSAGVGCVIDVSSQLHGSSNSRRTIIGPTNSIKVGTVAAAASWPGAAGLTADVASLAAYIRE